MNAVVTYPASQTRLVAREFEQISVGAVATALTAAYAASCFRAAIKVENGGTCRYRIDGTAPTAAIGTLLFDGEQLELSHDDAMLFQAFRVGAVNPLLDVTYLRP